MVGKIRVLLIGLLFIVSCRFDSDVHKYVVRINDWSVLEYYLDGSPESIQWIDFYYTPVTIGSGYLPLYTKTDRSDPDMNTQAINRLFRLKMSDTLDIDQVLYNDSIILSPQILFKRDPKITEKGLNQVIKTPIDSIQYDSIYRKLILSKPTKVSYEKIKIFEWASRGILK